MCRVAWMKDFLDFIIFSQGHSREADLLLLLKISNPRTRPLPQSREQVYGLQLRIGVKVAASWRLLLTITVRPLRLG